jgi:hypothetical protein
MELHINFKIRFLIIVHNESERQVRLCLRLNRCERSIFTSVSHITRRILNLKSQFLDAIAKLRKAIVTLVMSVRPSFCMEQLCSLGTDFN